MEISTIPLTFYIVMYNQLFLLISFFNSEASNYNESLILLSN